MAEAARTKSVCTRNLKILAEAAGSGTTHGNSQEILAGSAPEAPNPADFFFAPGPRRALLGSWKILPFQRQALGLSRKSWEIL